MVMCLTFGMAMKLVKMVKYAEKSKNWRRVKKSNKLNYVKKLHMLIV